MHEMKFRPQRPPLVEPGQVEHYVSDLTVTASAQLTLGQLQERLAERDQWLPMDGNPNLSLRELINFNSSGPLRLGFGAWRDLLLGMQFTTRKTGKLITAGGRTMKNVAGYDLTKFMVGGRGLFGQIVTFTTRTYKRPAAALLAKFPMDSSVGEMLPTPLRPQWAMLADGALWCGYLGDEKSIAFYESELSARQPQPELRRHSPQDDIEFRARHWSISAGLRYRASVPPARVLEFVGEMNDCAADPVFGIVVGASSPQNKNLLRAKATSVGWTVAFDDDEDAASFFGASGAE